MRGDDCGGEVSGVLSEGEQGGAVQQDGTGSDEGGCFHMDNAMNTVRPACEVAHGGQVFSDRWTATMIDAADPSTRFQWFTGVRFFRSSAPIAAPVEGTFWCVDRPRSNPPGVDFRGVGELRFPTRPHRHSCLLRLGRA